MGLDYGHAVHLFENKLRRDYGRDSGFCWVEHKVAGSPRLNRHFVQWGSARLKLDDLNDFWLKVYGSLVTWRKKRRGGMVVGSAEKEARYLARYIAGEGFVKARFSYNWLFPKWFSLSKLVHRDYGEYLSVPDLASLAGMSPNRRLSDFDWLLNTGYLSSHYEKTQA